MINLSKQNLVDLSKRVALTLEKKNLTGVDATVALVLDVSKSMSPIYKNGVIQNVIERVLALAMNFDSRKQIDAFVFGTGAKELEPITFNAFEGYVEREILAKHSINQATQYAKAIELVNSKYFGKTNKPIYVIFITDGDDSNKKETSAWIKQLCRQPIFWKFIGIGKEEFKFLSKLDDLEGRAIDNTSFFQVNDIATISDNDLYDRLLDEFSEWLTTVKKKGILSV